MSKKILGFIFLITVLLGLLVAAIIIFFMEKSGLYRIEFFIRWEHFIIMFLLFTLGIVVSGRKRKS